MLSKDAKFLPIEGIEACGIIGDKLGDFPKELQTVKPNKFDYHLMAETQDDDIDLQIWMDNTAVTVATIIHPLASNSGA